jgi:MFS family permease
MGLVPARSLALLGELRAMLRVMSGPAAARADGGAGAAASGWGDAEPIALVGYAHGTSHFLQLTLPPLFPWLTSHFALSFTRVGALLTLFYVISGGGQAAAGFLVDRLGARRVLCAGLAALGAAALLVATATGYPMLLLAATLGGLGNAVFHPADFTLLNRHVAAGRLGHAFSAHGLFGYAGWAAAPVVVGGAAAALGWRGAAAVAALVPLSALALLLARRRVFATARSAPSARAEGEAAGSPFAFLAVGTIWICFLFFMVTTLASGALHTFAPTVLQRTHGLSLRAATTALSLYMVGGAGGMLLGGFLSARGKAHGRRIAIALVLAATVSIVLATGRTPGWTVPIAVMAMGFFSGIVGPSRDLLVRQAALERFGSRSFGRIYGFVYSGFDVGGATAPLLFAGFLDRGLFHHVLAGVAALQLAAILTAIRIRGAPDPASGTPPRAAAA